MRAEVLLPFAGSRGLRYAVAIAIALGVLGATANADRVKDLATIAGVRDNHLTGFGIVVGLPGTGDDARSPMVRTSLAKLLKRLGLTVSADDIKSKNVAAVALTGELPAFAKPGQPIDITISSLGNASSLAGGTLLAAPLKGPDARTWAIAQGAIMVGGFAAEGASGSSAKKGITTVGTLPGGALVEASAPTQMPAKELVFVLKTPDFTTASRMQAAIDTALGTPRAKVADASSVIVPITAEDRANVAALIAKLEAVQVDPDVRARVVVDEKTGTVVVGEAVTLRAAAITYGALTIEVEEQPTASQPAAPFGKGETKVLPKTKIDVKEEDNPIRTVKPSATVADVAAALASLGAKPRDLVAILRALAAAGALRADVVVL